MYVSWTIKKAECPRIDAFELWCWRRLLRVPWTARRSNQSILKEFSPGCSLDVEAETPILWPPDAKNWLIGKDPDAGKDWGQEEKGMTEDEMVGWHHRLNGHRFWWTPGVGAGQGGLACCDSWGLKELDTTEQLDWADAVISFVCCCCWVTSVVSDSVRPHRWQPTRLPCPWDSPGKNTAMGCHFLLQCMEVKRESEVAQSCPTLQDSMYCSLRGSSIHGIFQARVLEWGAIAFSAL